MKLRGFEVGLSQIEAPLEALTKLGAVTGKRGFSRFA
ncbi:hypothetical protein SRABI102_02425 [Stenotrophomonas lactitubi]|jgi:hypothetical protein|nr:hypothetical protein SRABI102_02425 [Stenotrophomonas lactitubi]CAH0258359.1 hypothetical protein SRABI66_03382 [Stenotrophomonas lactitubi]CAH0268400.1 hypothetical protein SRABI122_03585 [Stenotrophomonas lactitubi]CAH0275369.1 hypothetical protein SRABI81_03833 [Stenotrophomonas lactitubi]